MFLRKLMSLYSYHSVRNPGTVLTQHIRLTPKFPHHAWFVREKVKRLRA